jgi:branched-chain amino acid transport system ATP-binding protein
MGGLLDVSDLRKSFGGLRAVDDVTLEIEPKSITILVGPNGSGKTTLINTIMGIYKPDSGSVFFGGTDVTGWPPRKLYKLGMTRTFQTPQLFAKMTVLENLLVVEKVHPGESILKAYFRNLWIQKEEAAVESAMKIIDTLGLTSVWDSRTSTLSGGQTKLVEIGRAMMSGASLLLLDEPISGVNPTLAHEIFGKVKGLRDEYGITFLIVEHRLDIALQYTDKVAAMASGKLIATGMPDEVMSDQRVIEAYLGG